MIRTLAVLIAAVFAFNALPAFAQSSSTDKSGSMDKMDKKSDKASKKKSSKKSSKSSKKSSKKSDPSKMESSK